MLKPVRPQMGEDVTNRMRTDLRRRVTRDAGPVAHPCPTQAARSISCATVVFPVIKLADIDSQALSTINTDLPARPRASSGRHRYRQYSTFDSIARRQFQAISHLITGEL